MSNRQVIVAKVLIEGSDEPTTESLRRYVITALKQSCNRVRGGSVATALYEEDGETLIGLDLVGTPSEEMREIVDDMFDGDLTEQV